MSRIGADTMRRSLVLVLLLLAGCDDRPGAWSAIVYPDRADRSKFVVTPHFSSASYCLENAKEKMLEIQVAAGGAYECGYDCEQYDLHRMNVCKKYSR
jgi:hypothetical protein